MNFRPKQTCDEGVVTAFVLGLMMTFVACAGLGVDGGRLMATRLELADHAENAARTGAQELRDLRSGEPKIDQTLARRSSLDYLDLYQLKGEIEITDSSVTVTVSRTVDMTLLKLFGANSHLLSVSRTAEHRDK